MLTDPDRMVRRLWRLRERLSSPVSSVPYESSGAVLAETCPSCAHPYHFRAHSGVESCARCGLEWPIVEGRVAKGGGKHRPRTNRLAERYEDLSFCVFILSQVPEPARTLYEHYLSPFGGGARYAISAARSKGELRGPFSERSFRGSIKMAREIVGLHLTFHALRGAA